MIVTREDVTTAVALFQGNPAQSFFDLVKTIPTPDFYHEAVQLMARGGPKKLTPEEHSKLTHEIHAQSLILYSILGPIWIANNRRLPAVTSEQIKRTMESFTEDHDDSPFDGVEPVHLRNQASEYFETFKKLNPFWYGFITDSMKATSDGFSIFVCAWLAKSMTDNLPEPLQPSPADIGGAMLENL